MAWRSPTSTSSVRRSVRVLVAARVQLKVDAEFPRFAQHLLERVYPHYLAPTPSMAVVQFQPDSGESTLMDGPEVPRHTSSSILGKGEQTLVCTAHGALMAGRTIQAEYLATSAAVTALASPTDRGCGRAYGCASRRAG
ncbi:MAG: type VI secretion system baseplate subunit TssF [Gammaproteobacteria bacterium]